MELVVDANVLFSFFKKDSTPRELILDPDMKYGLKLFSAELVLKEIGKHKNDVCKRFKLAAEDFNIMFSSLRLFVNIVKDDSFTTFIPEAISHIEPHTKDVAYVALALSLKATHADVGIWSNDSLLKKQPAAKVFSTSELVAHLKSLGFEFPASPS